MERLDKVYTYVCFKEVFPRVQSPLCFFVDPHFDMELIVTLHLESFFYIYTEIMYTFYQNLFSFISPQGMGHQYKNINLYANILKDLEKITLKS